MQPECTKSFLPVKFNRGYGHLIWEDDGREFIDFTSGIFVANVGHGNKAVADAIRRAVSRPVHAYNYSTNIREEYTEALCKKTGFECVALFSAGCEAVEAALRVMRHYQKKSHWSFVMHTPGKFMHGKTLGASMHMGMALVEGKIPFKGKYVLRPCGIILESYRGWDAHFWDKKWIQDLRAYCTEHDILLCFDEIQSGFGRTGRFFCYEHYEVQPDLICIGKSMGGGLPISGLLGPKNLLDLPGDLSSTHSGNPLACTAALAVLEEIDRLKLIKESERKGKILGERLFKMFLKGSFKPPVKGAGMVAALMMPTIEDANRIVMECFKRGLLVVHTGRESVKIGPPLTISDEALNKGLNILEGVLNGR